MVFYRSPNARAGAIVGRGEVLPRVVHLLHAMLDSAMVERTVVVTFSRLKLVDIQNAKKAAAYKD